MKAKKPGVKAVGRVQRTAEKRAGVLEAAAKVFLSGGYLGASMDEIADLAGVSKQTVYTYFSNKEALFAAMDRRSPMRPATASKIVSLSSARMTT